MKRLPKPNLSPEDIARFWAKVDRRGANDCWLWRASTDTCGYGKFVVTTSTGRANHMAHRLALLIATGTWPVIAMHVCDTPGCVNPRHIIGGTQADNVTDMWRKKRGRPHEFDVYGERHGEHKLTFEQTREIKELYASGLWTQRQLARRFAVAQSHISFVINNKRRSRG